MLDYEDAFDGQEEDDETPADLAQALERVGISQPPEGLVQAWREKTAPLEGARPSADRHALDALGVGYAGRLRGIFITENDDGSADVEIHTRNGGGNREDYEDEIESLRSSPYFVSDEDDSFDSTYADFQYEVPAGEDADLLRQTEQVRQAEHSYNRARDFLSDVEKGEVAPWSVLADPAQLDQAKSEVYKARLDSQSALGSFVIGGREAAESRAAFDESVEQAISDSSKDPDFTFDHGLRGYEAKRLEMALNTSRSAQKEAEKAQAIGEEAHALPSGPLRDHLLDEPPAFTVMRDENAGTRKRKKMVERTIQPKSVVDQMSAEAQRKQKSAAFSMESSMDTLSRRHGGGLGSAAASLKAYDAAQQRVEAARDHAWSLGWPGPGDPPSRPEASPAT